MADEGFTASARRLKHSVGGRGAARFGLGSRALVYLTLAVLVTQLAFGVRRLEVDQGGALRTLGGSEVGKVSLVAFAIGVACYAGWRWAETWLGAVGDHRRRTKVMAFLEGAAYVPFGYIALSVAFGDDAASEQGRSYRTVSARIMQSVPGQFLVGAVGVVVVGVGVVLASQGVRRSFVNQLDFTDVAPFARRATIRLGTAGSIGRGIVFALAGVLVVYAAITAEPAKAGGVDEALETVARQPLGVVLLIAAALSFAAFGLFTIGEAAWRRTAPDER